jgi:hypothetical protein
MSYSLYNTVEVQIRDDADLVTKFLKWQLDKDVYSNYTTSGCGHYRGIFDKKDEAELDEFFAKHG